MDKKRVTLSLSDTEWGFLHSMRLLFSIGDPSFAQIPGYNEIIKTVVYEVQSLIESSHFFEVFKSDLVVIQFTSHNSIADYETAEKENADRLILASVIPKGNYIINLDEDFSIQVLAIQGKLLQSGLSESETTIPKVIKRCINFVRMNKPFADNVYTSAFISNLYGMPLEMVSLLTMVGKKYLNKHISEIEYRKLETMKKDLRTFISFTNEMADYDLKEIESLFKNLKGKFWSVMGFDFLRAVLSYSIGMPLIYQVNKWIVDLFYDAGYKQFVAQRITNIVFNLFSSMEHVYKAMFEEEEKEEMNRLHESVRKLTHGIFDNYS